MSLRLQSLHLVFCIIMAATPVLKAQTQLDGRPLDPELDPDIDLFMSSWKESIPYNTHGTLTERFIFTRLAGSNHLKPERRGAVLRHYNRISRATLDPAAVTTPTTLTGGQEILYFKEGEGYIEGGGKQYTVRNGIMVLVPEGYNPSDGLLVKDEKRIPYRDEGMPKTHWSHNGKGIFTPKDGLASLSAITLITFNAMTIGHPHSHGDEYEEVWLNVQGRGVAFLGKEIRWQEEGDAYKIPQTGYTPHSNINVGEEPVTYLYISFQPEQ